MCYSRFIIEEPPADTQEALQLHNRVWQAAMQAVIDNGGMINEHHGIGLKPGPLHAPAVRRRLAVYAAAQRR